MQYIIPIILSLIINFAVGMTWYGPLFGKPWMKLKGLTEKDLSGGNTAMAYTLITGFVSLCLFAFLFNQLNYSGWFEGLTLGLVMATFSACLGFNDVVYDKPEDVGNRFKDWVLYLGYQVVTLGLIGIIFGLFF